MFLPPPLKSSAAIFAASTEPMPLVSWKMPEISLSTPTRTTSPEISACADPAAAQDNANARYSLKLFINSLPLDLIFCRCRTVPGIHSVSGQAGRLRSRRSNLPFRQAQHEAVKASFDFDLAGQTT